MFEVSEEVLATWALVVGIGLVVGCVVFGLLSERGNERRYLPPLPGPRAGGTRGEWELDKQRLITKMLTPDEFCRRWRGRLPRRDGGK